ncbi:hypothetical protein ACL7TT_05115 [Microbulbifer sp. 2304DJ12-6]|uniref:hypothetical protein n=1 Tax=Microbulbifer sp. 2304DJ12-6 TaxID=3233340 RepID=UPI00261277CD|nr:hypothetical protein [uncultured Microbulbifer sp.]
MPILTCRLFAPLHLGEYFIITPVAIRENAVDLHIAPGKGNRLVRAMHLLQFLDEARAQENTKATHLPTSPGPFKRRPNKRA